MTNDKHAPRYYDVPDWPSLDALAEGVDLEAKEDVLLEHSVIIGEMVTDALAACDMSAHKAWRLEDEAEPSDEDIARLDSTKFALVHLRARTRRLIAIHGAVRAALGLDPIFTIACE